MLKGRWLHFLLSQVSACVHGAARAEGIHSMDLFMLKDFKAGAIRRVNPCGGTKNCVDCVVATDALLAGHPASALPGAPCNIDVLEKIFGAQFGRTCDIREVIDALALAGPGSRGIVFGLRGRGVGHVFNAANQNGTIRFLDGQTGKAAELDCYTELRLLRTR